MYYLDPFRTRDEQSALIHLTQLRRVGLHAKHFLLDVNEPQLRPLVRPLAHEPHPDFSICTSTEEKLLATGDTDCTRAVPVQCRQCGVSR